ncbi:PhnD/SsuA/transferrin family substrate-binding protein [Yoonia sp. SS1-5]|uniref:Phosphate/phosphite/phosphonate ABC transporter substrate-binding protein n=1 Tax=Yoonia rhodophyticola TaxID=3137370 RepID=A0AAN0MIJ1_9RHOB
MIASLPMYARPVNRAAHDLLWELIRDGLRRHGIAAPDRLDHDINYFKSWGRPDLVLGQICNLPYRAVFHDSVTRIGAADHNLPGCPPGYYNSVIVMHQDREPTGATLLRFACNDLLSQSGHVAMRDWAAENGVTLKPPIITGSHHQSVAAIANGTADIASIDANTWIMECADGTAATQCREIGRSAPSPGMTFITRSGEDPAPYFKAISAAIHALPGEARVTLNLRGIVALPDAAYGAPVPDDMQTAPA